MAIRLVALGTPTTAGIRRRRDKDNGANLIHRRRQLRPAAGSRNINLDEARFIHPTRTCEPQLTALTHRRVQLDGTAIVSPALSLATAWPIRRAAARLAVAVAGCLQIEANNTDAAPTRRLAWSASANQLHRAASDLVDADTLDALARSGSGRVAPMEAAASFAVSVAGRLEIAARDPDTAQERRHTWTTAAARLQRAASELADPCNRLSPP